MTKEQLTKKAIEVAEKIVYDVGDGEDEAFDSAVISISKLIDDAYDCGNQDAVQALADNSHVIKAVL